jgi:protein tyrosine phosphatase (PTP) superfamily phosphohydrolase (DUF442 family)
MTPRVPDCRRLVLLVVLGLVAATAGMAVRQPGVADSPAGPLPVGNPTAVELPGLHNVFRLSDKLYTGSAPEADPGFHSLQRLGIRTILTVDGARPDLDRAGRHGMRYVHIPFGYDGCPTPTANRIVRAVRDLPGPIYLHCHHGKHRAPTAAAFARIALDGLSHGGAIGEMERAGTGKEYVGLYRDVRVYHAPSLAQIDSVPADLPEVAPTPPLTEAMVRIDTRFGELLRCQKEGWRAPTEQTDRLPAYEALQLRELFTELRRTPEISRRTADFRARIEAASGNAGRLEKALRSGDPARADTLMARTATGCATCHARYRNVPQSR